ncbi:MAG: TonB-dependent receptor [Bacteroidetes bacterium]|nr:TonB-dependent receptor [Bacteroidota bacterium]MBU1484698.1 TonB-dependent receptor [Bacteroidota bacterium]MBU2267538.1 TonB-dependent receptor [Bacteroidota bacterium]MBU2376536.1 TonB-dependent receptor [Bacteroidota bacterium]
MRVSLILVLFTTSVLAQTGKIAGIVSDKGNSETLIGCTVGISGSTIGASTDIDGKYVISNLKAGTYKVIFRYLGYQTKEITDIVVAEGKVTNLNVLLEPSKTQQLSEVVVTATFRQANISALYAQQKNSAVISDGISAEVIKRSPDKNTGEVLKRVSGTTIQDNKFVIVRGLSDRYNSALIDGSPLPSTEPNRKAFSFDIVPSNLIDNVIISKTATPDLPADFAGGIVQVSTKDVPDQDFLSIGLGYGYNSYSTFKDFYSGDRKFADFLTFGNSSRKLSNSFPSSEDIIGKKISANQNIAAINLLNNKYDVFNRLALPSQNYQVTLGKVTEIGKEKNRFGTTLSLSYRTSENVTPDIKRQFFAYNYLDQQYLFSSNLGLLANFAYTYKKSKITFKNLYNRILDDRFTTRIGSNSQSSSSDNRFYAFDLLQKSILKSTIEGDHSIGEKKAKIKWNLSFSNILNDQPDQRKVNYKQNNPGDPFLASNTNTGLDNSRLFSSLSENIIWVGINYEKPVNFLDSKLKVGISSNYRTRDFNVRFIGLNLDNNYPNANSVRTRSLQTLFGSDLINNGAYSLDEIPNGNDRYKANSTTNSVFGMLDSKFTDKFRAVYGIRLEKFDLGLTTSVSNAKVASLNDLDILPSANLTYALTPKANLRLSYYRTLARPEFRELAPFSYYDYEEVLNVQGFAGLKRAFINNADLRYELYPSAGQIFSVSVFYKNFTNAIESSVYDANSTPVKTYFNSNQANVYGVELEARRTLEFINDKELFKNTTVYVNLSYSKSDVKEKNLAGNFTRTRPLTGQSPYIINAGFQESLFNDKISLNILYNRIGARLYSVGGGKIGDIYENERGSLDAQFGIKAFKSKGEFKLNAGNILNEYNNFYVVPISSGEHNLGNSTGTFKKYRTGANYSLSFTYNFK